MEKFVIRRTFFSRFYKLSEVRTKVFKYLIKNVFPGKRKWSKA